MYGPPAAAWQAGEVQWLRRLLAALIGLAVLAVCFYSSSQGFGGATILLWALLLGSVATAVLGLNQRVKGQLRWDGEHWHWSGLQEHTVTDINCVLDLQRLLLLRIHCDQGPRLWLWLESSSMDAAWLALRRAVVASQAVPEPGPRNSLP
jgi:toxin CptA